MIWGYCMSNINVVRWQSPPTEIMIMGTMEYICYYCNENTKYN